MIDRLWEDGRLQDWQRRMIERGVEDYRSALLEHVRELEILRFEASTGPDKECPRCGQPVDRDSADVGVGVIYGPYGCSCGWSESKEYDRLFGQGNAPEDYVQDTRGGWNPK